MQATRPPPSPGGSIFFPSPRRRGFAALQAAASSKVALTAVESTGSSIGKSNSSSSSSGKFTGARQASECPTNGDSDSRIGDSDVDCGSGKQGSCRAGSGVISSSTASYPECADEGSSSGGDSFDDGNGGNHREDSSEGGRRNFASASDGLSCAALADEPPGFLANAVGFVSCLRTLAACQMVSRAWRRSLGGDRGEALFGSIVRASGIPADLRPAVWQWLVLRAVSGDRSCVSGSGESGGVK